MLLSHGIYIYICIIIKDRAGLGLNGLGLGWAIGRVSDCICLACVDWGPSVAVDTSQVTDLLSRAHTCLWGGKTCYSLVMGSDSFWTDCCGGLLGRKSKHHTEAGPAVLGAWSPSLLRDLDPMTGVERVGLVYAQVQMRHVFFRVPSWATLIRKSSFLRDGTTWLWSSTIVRTGT
jgi:hypothetical protein